MKKSLIALAVTSTLATPLFAQSSVTLYGIIDAGITYTNNSGGNALWQAQSGMLQGSRWGLKGIEDLGGGTKAIFQIENGFNIFNGNLGQGGRMFGRQAYVGLTNDMWGTLTLGRQYDPLVDLVQITTFNGQWGTPFSHPSDIDNTNNGFRVNNAVKYVTPSWNGLSAEGMYAFGGVAGQFGQNSTVSGGLSYSAGPLYLGAAYFYAKNPASQFTDGNFVSSLGSNLTPGSSNGRGAFGYVGTPGSMQIIGAGGTYTIGPALIGLSFSNVRFRNAMQGSLPAGVSDTVWFNNYELWGQYAFTAATTLGLGYTYTMGKDDYTGNKPRYGQLNAMADYKLSKRTDVYLMGVYQRAWGNAFADIYQGVSGNQSTTSNQVLARVGIRHKF